MRGKVLRTPRVRAAPPEPASPEGVALVWFRDDLRLDDHPALVAAARHRALVPVYIWAPLDYGAWSPGAASRWWLHQSLAALAEQLKALGNPLVLRQGSTCAVLEDLAQACGATAIYWNRRYEPAARAVDELVARRLSSAGLRVETFNGALLNEPDAVLTKTKTPYKVFTPYWRACEQLAVEPQPLPAPRTLPPRPPASLTSDTLASWGLQPEVDWAAGLRARWTPGEAGAQAALAPFLAHTVAAYAASRDRPDQRGTSRLSPHLHFGEISPRRILRAARDAGSDAAPFLRQLVWREFSVYLLTHFPTLAERPLRREFEAFPWRRDAAQLRRWQTGRTGYPVVDAGLRELWSTGWMHNRVRMVAASFLVKHLLLRWQDGARWFWDTLVDADLANNTMGWQWVAGCGADAAPYFRVFNPIIQGERFDPEGLYVRRWVPELARLPSRWIHRPWEAPPAVLQAAGLRLGRDYPKPLVAHAGARLRALVAYAHVQRAVAAAKASKG